jgi:hypothetical protein
MGKTIVYSRLYLTIICLKLSKHLALLVIVMLLGKLGGLFPVGYSPDEATLFTLVLFAALLQLLGRYLSERGPTSTGGGWQNGMRQGMPDDRVAKGFRDR